MSSALTKIVGMPALIMVALKVPTPGTSRSSTRLPVGNIEPPPPSSSAAGSRNSICTSAAGKVTPSSSKSPVSCTSPLVIGTWAMMVLPMLACHTRTTATPLCGMRLASTRPLLTANEPTAADRLPQLPLQSTKGLSMDT
ncbi:hypothetical protein D3C76_1367810 [compost metagenome]